MHNVSDQPANETATLRMPEVVNLDRTCVQGLNGMPERYHMVKSADGRSCRRHLDYSASDCRRSTSRLSSGDSSGAAAARVSEVRLAACSPLSSSRSEDRCRESGRATGLYQRGNNRERQGSGRRRGETH